MRGHDGKIRVEARNTGGSHVQLGQLDIALARGGELVASRNMAAYVLPDNDREWLVNVNSAPPAGTLLSISSQSDAGKLRAEVKLEDDAREPSPTTPTTASR
jgi:P pilus assembly chaperone PapD